jgi:hypothetical protein
MKPLTKFKDALYKRWWLLLLALVLLASLGIWWYFDYKIEQLKQMITTFSITNNKVL